MNTANHVAHLFSQLGKYCALAIVIAFTQSAIAQETDTVKDTIKDMERNAETADSNPLVEADKAIVSQVPARPSSTPISNRPPLLREGSFLTEVACILEHDPDVGFWIIRLVENSERVQSMPDKFVVLPSTKLNQMQRTIESTNMDIVFQVTGRIFVYEEINYLLPLSAPLLERYDETQESAAAVDGAIDAEESAEELINRLKREVQLPKSLPIGSADKPKNKDKGAIASLLSEGTLLLSRRGQVKRTANGGWQFVFSSDSSGLEDPPMAILPCLLLEKMQEDVQRQTHIQSILITGQVYTYKERNYLIPTMYRIEREHKNIR